MEINATVPGEKSEGEEIHLYKLRPAGAEERTSGTRRPLAMIVAVGADGAIGRDGDLLRHLPGDLARFKRLTSGHAVIMGRKTWESLPKRPLTGRLNIVITSRKDYEAEGAILASTPAEAIDLAEDDPLPFVIGGGSIYTAMLPLTTHLFLTETDALTPDADTFFPRIDRNEWMETERSADMQGHDGESYRFVDLIRRNK